MVSDTASAPWALSRDAGTLEPSRGTHGATDASASDLEVRTMKKDRMFSENKERLIDEAIELFQPLSPDPLTREDGREIYENLTGFFTTLIAMKQDRDEALRRQADEAETAAEDG